MAKRFTDSEKWDDPFFLDMKPEFKLLYLYMLDKCDAVGVWKKNMRMACFCIGEIDENAFLAYMGDRIHAIDNEKWWIVKFCDFQYGELSEESHSKPIMSYIRLLKKHNLWKGYTKGMETLKEKEKEKDKEKDKENASQPEPKKTRSESDDVFEKLWGFYGRIGNKKSALACWKKLTSAQKDSVKSSVRRYVDNTHTDGTFPSRKHLSSWLNPKKEHWLDEVQEQVSSASGAPKVMKKNIYTPSEEPEEHFIPSEELLGKYNFA